MILHETRKDWIFAYGEVICVKATGHGLLILREHLYKLGIISKMNEISGWCLDKFS